ncbi:DUF2095 family protein [Thermosphaera chiliense]|uniref:DUF2095 family protein n=1 Tax=Thermosphaera chiliense TaxID=3402707 RepID=A0A7M1USJ6_9CREN|nr:DUF2095 family protein [Thermosphaera aggregans]QOR94507.1 DUF2095 family protein [Thermosphaera aggregans]
MIHDIEEFRKKYPNLYKELVEDKGKSITVGFDPSSIDPWRGYVPGVVDYIRRCRSVEEALRVVDYLRERGEIGEKEASELKNILEEKGLGFFGGRKSDDYYYREASKYWESLRARRSDREGD